MQPRAPLQLVDPDFKIIDQVHDQFGPTLRLCFDIASTPRDLETYMRELRKALHELTPLKLAASIDKTTANLTMNAISSTCCLIRRVGSVKALDGVEISTITDFVSSQLSGLFGVSVIIALG
jgi:hypothetical protein